MVWRTTFITMSTCFLLGTTFTHWIADHNVLWRNPVTSDALATSVRYYSYLSSAPRGLGWVYCSIGLVAILSVCGRGIKGYKGNGGEVLFDGGSLVLSAAIAYTQLADVGPTISLFPSPLPENLLDHPTYPGLVTAVRDLATSNIMTAVMLTGLMLLQAGRYYAKRPSSSPPTTVVDPSASTPPRAPSPEKQPSPISLRSSTPFRELTEEEAMELNGSDVQKSASKRRGTKKR
ncbi:hypothetical protein IAR55_002112 [Kwoniella newhampshirensis]|uniref:ER membrane protein SH3 n=1 Tax=Kwoniella newhampshirensis TaxID=1651941 RepID=A0AAW0Z0Z3_9TREE